jgi:hypothetical protein
MTFVVLTQAFANDLAEFTPPLPLLIQYGHFTLAKGGIYHVIELLAGENSSQVEIDNPLCKNIFY